MPQDFTPAEQQQLARDGFVIRERAFTPSRSRRSSMRARTWCSSS